MSGVALATGNAEGSRRAKTPVASAIPLRNYPNVSHDLPTSKCANLLMTQRFDWIHHSRLPSRVHAKDQTHAQRYN